MYWKFVIYFIGGYLSLCLFVYLFQEKLLYLPDTTRISAEDAKRNGLRYWPSYDEFLGFISDQSFELTVENDTKQFIGTVIVFHGNAGAAYHRKYYVDAMTLLGYRVILAEYPGYGGKQGTPNEKAIVSDALKTIERASQDFNEPMYLWGESLGSGVVASVVNRIPLESNINISGLVLLTPWDSLPKLAQTHYSFLPTWWLVKDQYDSVTNLRSFKGKVAIVLAGQDEVIPISHGKRLYQSIETRKLNHRLTIQYLCNHKNSGGQR